MRKKIMAILALITLAFGVAAAPSIGAINSGTVTQGQALSFSGSNFGTKSTAQPWVWDDFESGQEGVELKANTTGANWVKYSGGGGGEHPKYRIEGAYAGNLGATKIADHTYTWSNFGVKGLNSDEMYISWMFKWTVDAGELPSLIMKFLRLNGGLSFYTGKPSVWVTMTAGGGTYSNFCPDANGGAEGMQAGSGGLGKGKWYRWETYWKLSTPGQKNGEMEHFVNLKSKARWENAMTRSAEMTASDKAGNFMLPMMHDNRAAGAKITYRVDNVYVDRTRARVEIGDQPVWGSCAHREIQIPQNWSSNQISIKVSSGTFKTGDRAYLFVVDANGVPSVGYPIIVGKGAVSTRIVPAKANLAGNTNPQSHRSVVFDVLGRSLNQAAVGYIQIGSNTRYFTSK